MSKRRATRAERDDSRARRTARRRRGRCWPVEAGRPKPSERDRCEASIVARVGKPRCATSYRGWRAAECPPPKTYSKETRKLGERFQTFTTIPSGVPTPIPMARRGPQYDLLQLLLRGGDQASGWGVGGAAGAAVPGSRSAGATPPACLPPRSRDAFSFPRFKRAVAWLTLRSSHRRSWTAPPSRTSSACLTSSPPGATAWTSCSAAVCGRGGSRNSPARRAPERPRSCVCPPSVGGARPPRGVRGHRRVLLRVPSQGVPPRVRHRRRGGRGGGAAPEPDPGFNNRRQSARRARAVQGFRGAGVRVDGRRRAKGDGLLEGDRELLEFGNQLGLLVVDSLSQLLSPVLTRMHHQGYTAMASVGAALRALAPSRTAAPCSTPTTPSAPAPAPAARKRFLARRGQARARHTLDQHAAQAPVPDEDLHGRGGRCGAEVIYGPGTGSAVAFQVVGDGIRTL